MSAEIARAASRPPFGIRNGKAAIGGCLLLGAVPLGLGLALKIGWLSATGLCFVLIGGFLALAFASARRQRVALIARDDGLVIEAGLGSETVPWAEITGIVDGKVRGRSAILTLETRGGRKQIGTMAIPPDALATVIAEARARIDRAA